MILRIMLGRSSDPWRRDFLTEVVMSEQVKIQFPLNSKIEMNTIAQVVSIHFDRPTDLILADIEVSEELGALILSEEATITTVPPIGILNEQTRDVIRRDSGTKAKVIEFRRKDRRTSNSFKIT